jgi:hypothetical protein
VQILDLAQRLMAALKERQEEMQLGVLKHPPANYSDLMRLVGQWQENQAHQETLKALMRKTDREEL